MNKMLAGLLLSSIISCTSAQTGMELLLSTDFEGVQVEESSMPSTTAILRLEKPTGEEVDIGVLYSDDNPDNRYAKVVDDGTGNSVLKYWVQGTDTKKGRIQLNLTDVDKTSVFERFRMYLHPDIRHYKTYPKENTWFTINEMMIGDTRDPITHDYPFRISLRIAKEAGVGIPLHFFVLGSSQPQYQGKWVEDWHYVDMANEIPLGEWLTVEIGYKRGDNSTGRYYVAAKRDTDPNMTPIFDITDWTYSPYTSKPAKIVIWNPFKLYTSKAVIDHIRNQGGVAQIYWDDLEIWGK